jgi:hypothetical protein
LITMLQQSLKLQQQEAANTKRIESIAARSR